MTISELIEKLECYDPDTLVIVDMHGECSESDDVQPGDWNPETMDFEEGSGNAVVIYA